MKLSKLIYSLQIAFLLGFMSTGVMAQAPTKGMNQELTAQPQSASTSLVAKSGHCTETSCNDPIPWPTMTNGTEICIDECNEGADSGPNFVGNNCYDHPNPTVWFEFTTTGTTATIDVSVVSSDIANPYFSVFGTTDCSLYTTYNNNGDCFNGAGGATSGTVFVPANTTLLIAVSGAAGQEGDFTLCITPQADASACNQDDEIVVTATSMGSPLAGPYQPGETVSFCYNINQYTQANCNWLHGIVPTFGDCWDPASFNASGQPVSITTPLQQAGSFCPGEWNWWEDGDVQYNTGANVGAGWFYSLPAGTNPNDSWGDANGMCASGMGACEGDDSGLSWSVCFDLTVRTDCENGTNCAVSMKTYADGETGNWTSLGCVADIPTFYNAAASCCGLEVDAGANASICSDQTIQLNGSFSNEEGATTVVWSASPAGALAGLSDPNILDPVFTPPPGISGPITFTLSVTDDDCTIVDDVVITVNLTPVLDPIGNVVICDSYTLPAITGTNLTGNEAYYTGAGGTGTQFNAGDAFTTVGTTTLFIYDQTGTTPNCFDEESFDVSINLTPVINPLANVVICDSYTLPAITGTNLTGNEAYYTGTGGTGTQFLGGATINFADFASYPVTLFMYDESGGTPNCFDEESFTLTINVSPIIDPVANLLACDSYTLPPITGTNLTGNQAYYTGVLGSGTQYLAGATINFADFASYPVTLYIYDQTGTTPNCFDQEQFILAIVQTPILDPVADVAVCNTYTFPAISGTNLTGNEAYFTGAGGTGDSYLPGQTFNTPGTTTFFIYNQTGTTPNCFDEETFELTINPLPVIAAVGQDPSVCDATDGEIEVTLSSGSTSAGTVSWTGTASGSNPGADITVDSPDITNLAAGSYNVTFTDANGCVSNTVNITLNNPGAPVINSIADYTSCNIDYELLLSNVTGTNLTANLAFYDAPGGSSGTGNVIADGTIFTAPTNTTIYVYDENGACDAEIQFNVVINENPTALISPDPAEACFGTAISLNGNPSGGSGVFSTNAWTGDIAIINNPNIVNPNTLISVVANTYNLTYTVTDNNGCIGSDDIQVIIHPTPAVTATNNGPLCDGLDITLNETAGDATSWSWASLNGAATFDDATLQSPTASNVADGEEFQVTILDANGCTNTTTTVVSVFPLPVVTPTNSSPVCAGEVITLNETGGDATSWSWVSLNGAATFDDAALQSPTVSNAVDGEEFQVTVLDANGCSSVLSTIVTVNPIPTVAPVNNGPICAGEDVTLNETGGDATSWSWTSLNGAATFNNATLQSPTASNVVDGEEFQVVIIDANGCSDSLTTTVTVNALPLVTPTSNSPICQGEDIVLDETGGDATSWSWSILSGIGSFDDANIQSPTVSNASNNDEFQVNIEDANGCINSSTIIVVVNPLPAINISNNGPICASDDVVLNETGGDATSWSWTSNGAATFNDATLQSPSATNAVNGEEFQVTITDINGCSQTSTTVVTVITSPVIDALGPIAACDTYELPVITGANLTGNQAYFNDTQANGGTVITGTITSSTTIYMFDGASGCFDEVQVDITINPLPDVTALSGAGDYCEDEVPADVTAQVTGAADWTIYFTLDGVSQTATGSASPINLGNAEGTYVLDSIADNNCSATANGSVVIFFKPTPNAPTAGNDATYCSTNDFENMFANGAGGTMTWFTDNSLTSVFGTGSTIQPANLVGVTSYYVTETINGCEGPSSEVVITIEDCDIILPTAFTPNNDGNNDSWEIPLLDSAYPNNIVYIYNRWGSLIFEHNSQDNGPYNSNQWDGTYNGNPLPVGSYFFVIDFNNADKESVTGAVSIILD